MFESAELGHELDKETYATRLTTLREQLLSAQLELARTKKLPVVIVMGGVDGAGRGEVINRLSEWMDPRHIQVNGMGSPTDEELQRPRMWRYWRALPPKGKIGVFLGSWYTAPFLSWVFKEESSTHYGEALGEIVRFEQMLVDEGALLLKFWMHLSKERQRQRLEELEADPHTRWRVSKRDWKHFELYPRFRKAAERQLRETSWAEAPWHIVDGSDERYRALQVGSLVFDSLHKRLSRDVVHRRAVRASPRVRSVDEKNVIQALDLTRSCSDADYEEQLEKYQEKLARLIRAKGFRDRSMIAVFEGNDAAGKGGAIRRVTGALDARQYSIVPVAAPSEEERAQPYLWRFWRHVPRKGRLVIFDRSWYGRVLVERVEKFCAPADWKRAYSEINDFEQQLTRAGFMVEKFWLAISKDEQHRRFKEREATSFKRFKITEEDWRNRGKWREYQQAVCEMVDRTSTDIAPWTLVEANDKRFARIKILKTLCKRLEEAVSE